MFICRWIGWNIKNSGNYKFSTIFGTACYSLSSMIVPNQIRNEMQCCQFLSHIPYTVLHNECICFGYSQRYFQNHIGREIIFSTTSLIFLLSSLCVNFMFIMKNGNSRVLSWSCKVAMSFIPSQQEYLNCFWSFCGIP